jgi:hypothetical protein
MRNANYVVLPTIVTGPGEYVTRCGERVTINEVRPGRGEPYAAQGVYANGVEEAWDVSGRLYPTILSNNDIVGR